MDKLSKNDLKRRDELAARLRDSLAALEDEHRVMVTAIEAFNAKLDAHNEIINEASGWRDDLIIELDEYMGGRSEKWLEGDKAQAIGNWREALEQLDLEPVEPIELPDMPDLLHADALDQMQTEAEG